MTFDAKTITDHLSVQGQIDPADLPAIAEAGFRGILCNRPDGEDPGQPSFAEIAAAAAKVGIVARHVPIVSSNITDADVAAHGAALDELPAPVLAYCRSGTRSTNLWGMTQGDRMPLPAILGTAKAAGYDLTGAARRIANGGRALRDTSAQHHAVVILGAGAAGLAVASSLLSRKPGLDVALIDPADVHYYQPGWTMVGAGIFTPGQTARTMASLLPKGVTWIKAAVAAFDPDKNTVILENSRAVTYDRLIVCPGLKLDWDAVEGLSDTLGRNGVTSNYRYDLAPYTWELVKGLREGRALFTQPPMPIKCAGAPQKAMYLSGDAWLKSGALKNIDIQFMNAGGVLFGVQDYVPALMDYVQKYDATLNFFHNLVAVDGPARRATFEVKTPDTPVTRVETDFDMIHVCPPQTAPDFIRVSPLADAGGWVDVDQATLRHKTHDNVWSLGDVMNAPNAKTAAAARMQAPVVAENVIADMRGVAPKAAYNGYGSCPLTVERGKIVLAEFGYGGTLLPSFPKAVIDGTKPSRAAWMLKAQVLPQVYWHGMLRGREWLAKPAPATGN